MTTRLYLTETRVRNYELQNYVYCIALAFTSPSLPPLWRS